VWIYSSGRGSVEQAREDFCEAMRHEIRTPLNGLLGMLESLLSGDLRPAQRDQATVALASARELAELLRVRSGCPDGAVPAAHFPKGLKVLVVDDNRTNQMVVEAILGVLGCTIYVACDGEEAVRMLRDGLACNIVLMDIQMPVMDGPTATRHIRNLPGPVASIPIIALTANVAPEQQAAYLAAGMDDFVPKPLELKVLLRAIVQAIERQTFFQPMRISV